MSEHPDETCWIPTFVEWAEGRAETLDFHGRPVPERLQRLLTALTPEHHVLSLSRSGWSLQHPLECRPALNDCVLSQSLARDTSGIQHLPPGEYDMVPNPDGIGYNVQRAEHG